MADSSPATSISENSFDGCESLTKIRKFVDAGRGARDRDLRARYAPLFHLPVSERNTTLAGWAPNTQKTAAAYVRRYARFLGEPVPELHHPPVRKTVGTIPDPASMVRGVLKNTTDWKDPKRLVPLLGLFCGLRVSEALAVTYDAKSAELHVPAGKSKARRVPVVACLAQHLEAGRLIPEAAATRREISMWFARNIRSHCGESGLRVTLHSTRHTFASLLLWGGINEHVVRNLLGHSSQLKGLLRHYYGSAPTHVLRDAVEQGLDSITRETLL